MCVYVSREREMCVCIIHICPSFKCFKLLCELPYCNNDCYLDFFYYKYKSNRRNITSLFKEGPVFLLLKNERFFCVCFRRFC